MFKPWRGDHYAEADNAIGGIRLMILGESHYSDHPEHPIGVCQPDMTEWVVERYLSGGLEPGHKRTLTKMAAIAARQPPQAMSWAERQALWHSVIFYNYIPVVAAASSAQPVPEAFWHGAAVDAFRHVIRVHEIEAILVCGKRLWDGMARAMPEEATDSPDLRRYRVQDDFRVVAAFMHHPAAGRGWSFERWKGTADRLYAEVAVERARHGHPPPGGAGVVQPHAALASI